MEIKIEKKNTILTGKTVFYLGSSVTYGAAALGTSFVEFISERNGSDYIKEAVSGTTLVDNGDSSYISRLKKVDTSKKIDLFICQLSTNDATQKKPLGSTSSDNTDTTTVCGAIRFIVNYVREKYDCPVIFYTNCYYESEEYEKMFEALKIIASDMNFEIIDMYSNKDFNDIEKEKYSVYMADKIHPTKAGYYYWWTPYMEEKITSYLSKSR